MKKTANRIVSILLIALLVVVSTACNKSDNDNTESIEVSSKQLSAELKEKYAEEEPFDYLDAVEKIKQTEILHLEVSFDPDELGIENLSEFVAVYVDKTLSIPLENKIEYDAEAGELLVHPPICAALSPTDERNKWGYAEVYYLAYFYSTVDGSKLDKPALAPFTIENELESPFLEFAKSNTGFATFNWTEVPGAEKYHICSFQKYESLTYGSIWSVGEDLTETTYVDEFIDNLGSHMMANLFYVKYEDDTSTYRYFYVVAEKNGMFSRASNIIDGYQILSTLPYFIDSSSEVSMAAMVPGDVSSMSGFVDVTMADRETVVRYPVTYDISEREVVNFGDYINVGDDEELANLQVMHFTFSIDGTGLSDHTYIKYYDYPEFDEELEAMVEKLESQKGKATKGNDTEISRIPDEKIEGSPKEDTLESIEFSVFATSALSEYLALNLLQGKEIVDLSDFPESRDSDLLMDAFFEVMYQNPLVMTVDSVGLSYDNKTLMIEYGQTTAELEQKQAEVMAEVKRVVQDIITDDMTDYEKEMAINDYLCESAEYDMDALENALENDMIVDASFNDSFTPYGILINKVGVCASYAAAFKLLADEAGLGCIVVTGYLNGNLPHAWNRVNINGEWMSIDTTNNDNPYLYNYLFNIPDHISKMVLVEDTLYVRDVHLKKYKGKDENVEFYRMANEYYAPEDIADALMNELLKNGTATLRTDYNLRQSELEDIFEQLMMDDRMTEDILIKLAYCDVYYDLGVISITNH